MLIRIDESVINSIKEKKADNLDLSSDILALNNLASASKHGNHILFGSVHVLEFLMKFEPLDLSSKHVYNSLFSTFSFYGSYQQRLKSFILIKSSTYPLGRTINDKGQYIFEVPLKYFEHINSILSTSFLCEDISDYKFYCKLARKYLKEKKLNMSLEFSFVNGGGNRSGEVYNNLLEESNNISLAIADSDKKYHGCKSGDTLKLLEASLNKHEKYKITNLVGLNVREKENLIPPSFYELCTNSSAEKMLEKLLLIQNSEVHAEKLLYLDIKDGMKVKKMKIKSEESQYFFDMFKDIPHLPAFALEEIEFHPDNEYIIRGIGNSILKNFTRNVLEDGLEEELLKMEKLNLDPEIISIIKKKIEKKNCLFNNIPSYIQTEVINLCEIIISWGCSYNHPQYTAGQNSKQIS